MATKFGGSKSADASIVIHGLMLICLAGIFVIQIVSISGGGSANNVMARAETMFNRYPTGQIETTLHQLLEAIENVHKASARADILLRSVNTDQVNRLINTTEAIEKRLQALHEIKIQI